MINRKDLIDILNECISSPTEDKLLETLNRAEKMLSKDLDENADSRLETSLSITMEQLLMSKTALLHAAEPGNVRDAVRYVVAITEEDPGHMGYYHGLGESEGAFIDLTIKSILLLAKGQTRDIPHRSAPANRTKPSEDYFSERIENLALTDLKGTAAFGEYREDIVLLRISKDEYFKRLQHIKDEDPVKSGTFLEWPNEKYARAVIKSDPDNDVGLISYLSYPETMAVTSLTVIKDSYADIREAMIHDLLYKAQMTDRELKFAKRRSNA